MTSFSNDFASLTHHQASSRGRIVDFVKSFHKQKEDISFIIEQAYGVFEELIQYFSHLDKTLKAGPVVQVNSRHINEAMEVIDDTLSFFICHSK